MEDIKGRIGAIISAWLSSGNEDTTYLAHLIVEGEVVYIAQEAFEAGYMRGVLEYEMKEREKQHPNCTTWIKHKFAKCHTPKTTN